VADETPVRLFAVSRVVLHVVPLASFMAPPTIDVTKVPSHHLPPVGGDVGWSFRLNLDGLVNFSGGQLDEKKLGYVQLFRSGAIEAAESIAYRIDGQPAEYIDPQYEVEIVDRLPKYLQVLQGLGIAPPVWIGLSMTGVKGLRMYPRSGGLSYTPGIDRDLLVLPDVLVEDLSADPQDFMKPTFDAAWQAAGHYRSYNYNDQGQWSP
jgi:hypothetical protein